MNKAFLIGNLTRDPEFGETKSGVAVCRFSLAVNRQFTNADGERETDFFNVTAWRGLAENVAKYCQKGSKVAVTGSVQMRNWEDNDGNKHQGVDIIAQDVEFLTPKKDGDDRGNRQQENGDKRQARKPAPEVFDYDDDIPF